MTKVWKICNLRTEPFKNSSKQCGEKVISQMCIERITYPTVPCDTCIIIETSKGTKGSVERFTRTDRMRRPYIKSSY